MFAVPLDLLGGAAVEDETIKSRSGKEGKGRERERAKERGKKGYRKGPFPLSISSET